MTAFRAAALLTPLLMPVLCFAQSAPVAQGGPNTSPAAVEAGSYVIEPKHTQVTFSVMHMGFSYYNGRFTDVSGKLELMPNSAASSTVRVSVPVQTVSTTSAKLDGELKEADWLDATAFPTITFTSTTVTPGAKGEAKIMGDLTLHGITKPVIFEARFVGSGVNPIDKRYTVGFLISGDIKRSDFGVAKLVPLISDTVHLEMNGVFEKQ